MRNSTSYSVNLTPLLIAVTVILTVLKLTGVIAWSWWVVTAPIWGTILAVVTIWILMLAIVGFALTIAAITAILSS